MCYDPPHQLSRYTGLSRSLDAAVKAITSADLFALPAGRHELVPDMVYAVVSQIETKPLAEAVLEATGTIWTSKSTWKARNKSAFPLLKIPG